MSGQMNRVTCDYIKGGVVWASISQTVYSPDKIVLDVAELTE